MPVTIYEYDLNGEVVEEHDENGNVLVDYTRLPDGTLISEHRGGASKFYHFDGAGNTLALTDINGDLTDTFAYNAFGELTARTGTTPTPYQYHGEQGYYRDSETGEYHVQRRELDTSQGRWLSADPLFMDGLPLLDNPYSYVGNRPTIEIDPTGMAPATGGSYIICKMLCDQTYTKPWEILSRLWCYRLCWTEVAKAPPPGKQSGGTAANYGRYCGPLRGRDAPIDFCIGCGSIATINLKAMKAAGIEPWDEVDEACALHDCCLKNWAQFRNYTTQAVCNKAFCEKLRDDGVMFCSKSATKEECLEALDSILNFSPFCAATPKTND